MEYYLNPNELEFEKRNYERTNNFIIQETKNFFRRKENGFYLYKVHTKQTAFGFGLIDEYKKVCFLSKEYDYIKIPELRNIIKEFTGVYNISAHKENNKIVFYEHCCKLILSSKNYNVTLYFKDDSKRDWEIMDIYKCIKENYMYKIDDECSLTNYFKIYVYRKD